MPRRFLPYALLLAFAPSMATAQTALPSPAPTAAATIPPAAKAVMTTITLVGDVDRATRQAMIAALTPAHRALLAKELGELALEPDPDFDSLAARLDATLSPAETHEITRLEAAKRDARSAMFRQIYSKMPSLTGGTAPPRPEQHDESRAPVPQFDPVQKQIFERELQAANDPAFVLLENVTSGLQPLRKLEQLILTAGARAQ